MNDLFPDDDRTAGTRRSRRDLRGTSEQPAAPSPVPVREPVAEPAARPKSRRRRTGATLAVTFLIFGGLVAVAVLAVSGLLNAIRTPAAEDFAGPGNGSVTIRIEPGQSGGDIGDTLVEAGVVASRLAFVRAFNDNPAAVGIQAGSYELMLEMRAADAVTALLDPANRAEYKLTVVEGLRASQVYERIASVTGIPIADVEAAAADTAAIGLPAEAGGNIEGWLAAATFTFDRDATAADVLRLLIAQTVTTLDQRAVPADQRQAVLIKASIVEKEVAFPDDYGRVARVIENRLLPGSETAGTLGMDSTLAYALNKSGLELSPSDLDSDNPYNTRKYPGLPPGPIGAPGTAAIDAVLAPPEGDWLYFVTVDPDTGETRFTADYQEHLANQALYREWLAQHAAEQEE